MQTKRLMSLLCLFVLAVLFSSVAGAAPAAAPVPTVTVPPAQCPTAPAPATPDFFKPAAPDAGVPEWQPRVGCSLAYCNRCAQDGGICQFTGGHCVCV